MEVSPLDVLGDLCPIAQLIFFVLFCFVFGCCKQHLGSCYWRSLMVQTEKR